MASAPGYAATPKLGHAQVATANTARDGTGTLGTVHTAGASGGRVERIIIMGVGTVTGGMVRLFVSTDGGTTKRLLDERPVTATTPSATVAGWRDVVHLALALPASALLYASTHNAETFNVFAEAADN